MGSDTAYILSILRYESKLAVEVSHVARVLLSDDRYAHHIQLHRMRKVPKMYGLLSAVLTSAEDDKLRVVCSEIAKIDGAAVRCLMYDGCVVEYSNKEALKCIQDALPSISDLIGIGVVVKP